MSMAIRPSIPFPSVNFIEPTLLESFECDDCFISFIQDSLGNKLVLKQIKDTSGDEQFLLVSDALACHMAEEMQIPMNQVTIIEPAEAFLQKKQPDFPATLHTMAKGKSTDQLDQNDPYKDIDIHQRFRRKDSLQEKKWGVLSPEQTGLTLLCIQEMARHPDLARIVALDTFVGNADRSAPNLFYDSITNQFCGIDMAAAFNSKLAKAACRQLQILIEKGIVLSSREKEALTKYVDTLKILLEKYSPKLQKDLLDTFSKKAGFKEGSSLLDQDVIERIEHYKRCINCNYNHSNKLVTLVYKLLKS